jgi:hypothetical protein
MLRRDAQEGRHARGELADEISASIAAPTPERADAGKDAARYQWLRDNCFDSTEPGDGDAFWHTELHFESDELQCFDKASLDNAIDAAILAANKETPERAEPRALTDDSLSALFKVLMRRNIECGIEAYLTLRCVGVPPSEKDFLSAIEQAVKER